jgi:hypothetical protein
MATLWIHKPTGCDFLVSFNTKVEALELARSVFDKAFTILNEEANYTLDEMITGGILVSDREIPISGINVGSISCLQLSILPPGYIPPQVSESGVWYERIAHVFPNDALTMICEKEPENFYIFPADFRMVNREEPYNFTRYVPSKYELDEELHEYMYHSFAL